MESKRDNFYKNELVGTIAIYDEKDNVLFDLNYFDDIESIKTEKISEVRLSGKGGIYKFTITFKNQIKSFNTIKEIIYNKKILTLDLSNFDSSKFTDMSGMFEGFKLLKYVNLSNLDTSNITNLQNMFRGCNKLKEIKGINKFNTSNVTNMNGMFGDCEELEYLDISGFDTTNVKSLSWTFSKCHKLKEIKGINKFNTSNVTEMVAMFEECKQLENLDLSNFDTSAVTNMNVMFTDCTKLKELNLTNFNINKVWSLGDNKMFNGIKNCKLISNDQKLIELFNKNK